MARVSLIVPPRDKKVRLAPKLKTIHFLELRHNNMNLSANVTESVISFIILQIILYCFIACLDYCKLMVTTINDEEN
jgi:hypothetical protein